MSKKNEISKISSELAKPAEETRPRHVSPPVDIFENEHEILLVADMPGVNKKKLDVNLNRQELTIEGVQDNDPHSHVDPLYFSRAFRVPPTVDPDKVEAELNEGVLRVHLKKTDKARPRKIRVHAG